MVGSHAPPPLPIKTYTTLVPIFEKNFFSQIREIKKRGHFAGMYSRNFEKG